MYSNKSPPTVPAGMVSPYISIPGRCGIAPSTGISLSRRYSSIPESREDVLIEPSHRSSRIAAVFENWLDIDDRSAVDCLQSLHLKPAVRVYAQNLCTV